MTREAKYGILMLIALMVIVPLVFILINLSVGALGLIFNYPKEVLLFVSGLLGGSYINNKLK